MRLMLWLLHGPVQGGRGGLGVWPSERDVVGVYGGSPLCLSVRKTSTDKTEERNLLQDPERVNSDMNE